MAEMLECGPGFYSSEGATNYSVCEQGHYCPVATTSEAQMEVNLCRDGLLCGEGVDKVPTKFSNACAVGHYCVN